MGMVQIVLLTLLENNLIMKKIILLLITAVTFSCSKPQKTEFSKAALSETLLATDGSQVAFKDILEKYKGKTVVIEVWASWCGDCVKAMPKLKNYKLKILMFRTCLFQWTKLLINGKLELKNTI